MNAMKKRKKDRQRRRKKERKRKTRKEARKYARMKEDTEERMNEGKMKEERESGIRNKNGLKILNLLYSEFLIPSFTEFHELDIAIPSHSATEECLFPSSFS